MYGFNFNFVILVFMFIYVHIFFFLNLFDFWLTDWVKIVKFLDIYNPSESSFSHCVHIRKFPVSNSSAYLCVLTSSTSFSHKIPLWKSLQMAQGLLFSINLYVSLISCVYLLPVRKLFLFWLSELIMFLMMLMNLDI